MMEDERSSRLSEFYSSMMRLIDNERSFQDFGTSLNKEPTYGPRIHHHSNR